MNVRFYWAVREVLQQKRRTLLLFFVSFAAMLTVLSALTNAAAAFWQQGTFADSLAFPMETILHLDYGDMEESPSLPHTLRQYRAYIAGLPGVQAVGRFDATGMYFAELKDRADHQAVNGRVLAGGKYADYPGISQLLSVDEALLPFVQGSLTEYAQPVSGALPLYASEVFAGILPVGTRLTDERTGEVYEVMGYFPRGSRWVEEDDLIRFPMVSLDGWFIAPFAPSADGDLMTQLSCLHNTYVRLDTDVDLNAVTQAIQAYPAEHGFTAKAVLLAEEFRAYCRETGVFTRRQTALAVFVAGMAAASLLSVSATGILLKRREYGVLLACGFARRDLAFCMGLELLLVAAPAALAAWLYKLLEFAGSDDLFREILLASHWRVSLPLCLAAALLLTIAAAAIPAVMILRCQPSQLTGGEANGAD